MSAEHPTASSMPMLDAQNPFLYYLVPTSDGQSMTMISVPADHHDPNALHGMNGLQATSLAFSATGAIPTDPATAQSLANGFLPPGIVIAPRPEYAIATSAGGDPLLGSVQVARASDLHHLNPDDLGAGSVHGQSTPRASKSHRPDIPHCSACGAFGKQLGRQGSRVKIDCCLCANCEDRIKRFKKDGFRKAARCEQSGELFRLDMVPICPVKHLRKHCPHNSCPNCRTSEQEGYCRTCQIAKILQCVDFDRFYRRQYKKRDGGFPSPQQANTPPTGANTVTSDLAPAPIVSDHHLTDSSAGPFSLLIPPPSMPQSNIPPPPQIQGTHYIDPRSSGDHQDHMQAQYMTMILPKLEG